MPEGRPASHSLSCSEIAADCDEERGKLCKGFGAVADAMFDDGAELSEGAVVFWDKEVWVVAEAACTGGLVKDASATGALAGDADLSCRVGKGYAADITCAAFFVRDIEEFVDQFLVIAFVSCVFAAEASGVDAGCAVEGVHGESAVFTDDPLVEVEGDFAGFFGGIFREGAAVFIDFGDIRELGDGDNGESEWCEDLGDFLSLFAVARGEDDGGHACFRCWQRGLFQRWGIAEDADHGLAKMTADGNAVATMDGFDSFPVGAGGSGFAEDGDECCDVPGRHQRIDGDFCAAGRDENVSAAVSPATGNADLVHDFDDGVKAAGFSPVGGFGEHQPCIGEGCALGGMRLAGRLIADLPPAAGTLGCVDNFVKCRHPTDTGNHAVFAFDADEGAEERNSVDKGFGAVDGVNDPAIAAASGNAWELFSQNGVIRVEMLDAVTDEQFGVAVGDGDGGFVGFGFDEQSIAAVVLENQQSGVMGQLECGLEALGEGVHGVCRGTEGIVQQTEGYSNGVCCPRAGVEERIFHNWGRICGFWGLGS